MTKFSWILFVRRALLNWRWWLILPYLLVIAFPVALLITLGDWLADNASKFEAPVNWWRKHALAKQSGGAQ